MDVEQLSKSDEQIEMMMQMDKIPEFCQAYNDVVEALQPPSSNFNSATITSSYHHPPSLSFSTVNPLPFSSTTISFNNNNNNNNCNSNINSIDEEPFLSNSNMDFERWRSSTQVNSINKKNSMAAMREMIFRIAAMQPIHIDPESVKAPKRRNVKISKDPQSVAARHRRERISEKIRILQRLVPGGTKMDTASMLDEAIHYVKFLKTQLQSLERSAAAYNTLTTSTGIGFPVPMSSGSCYLPSVAKSFQSPHHHCHHNV